MTIDHFIAEYPSHPLAAALDLLIANRGTPQASGWESFCAGAVFVLKGYGELSDAESQQLISEITGEAAQ